jgi:hypothetical protein
MGSGCAMNKATVLSKMKEIYESYCQSYKLRSDELATGEQLTMCEAAELDWLRGRRDGLREAFVQLGAAIEDR